MIGGLLAGIGITGLMFFVVWLLKNGNSPTPAVYVLLIVSLLVLCIEGIWMVKAIKANRNIDRTMVLVQETVMSHFPQQGLDYTVQPSEEAAICLGLSVLVPSAVDLIQEKGLSGKTVAESMEIVRQSVETTLTKKRNKAIWMVVITALVLAGVMYVAFPDSSGRRGAAMPRGTRVRASKGRSAPRRYRR